MLPQYTVALRASRAILRKQTMKWSKFRIVQSSSNLLLSFFFSQPSVIILDQIFILGGGTGGGGKSASSSPKSDGAGAHLQTRTAISDVD